MKTKRNTAKFLCNFIAIVICVVCVCCGTLSAADAGAFPILVGNHRESISLDGEWEYALEQSSDGQLPAALPDGLVFDQTVVLPSFSVSADDNARVWYRKAFQLANLPSEAVTLDFGSDSDAFAVYVNGQLAGQNIAPLLVRGDNTVVLLQDGQTDQNITDSVQMRFSSSPVIGDIAYAANPENGVVSFTVELFNPGNADLKTSLSITIKDQNGVVKGTLSLADISVPAGNSIQINADPITLKDFTADQRWSAAHPYCYTAEISSFGDSCQISFAVRDDALFGTEGYRYGPDLSVRNFLENEKAASYVWNAEWITKVLKLWKEYNWTVVAYRDGVLPSIWQELALQEGILLVDKNGDTSWAASQDALWGSEINLVTKAEELLRADPNAVVLPILGEAGDALYNEIPALQGLSAMRLKAVFSGKTAVSDSTPTPAGTEPEGNAFVAFFRGIIKYFKDMIQKTFIRDKRYKLFLNGLGNTLLVAVASTGFGVLIGMIIAIIKVWNHQMLLSRKRNLLLYILNAIAETYTTIIRGTPVVVQLLITYNVIFVFSDKAVLIGIFAFSINSGAYVSEIIRAGINSVDKGQTEAGRSLGLSQVTTMKSIVMPQAFKNILPALGNEFISVLKETSVIGYLGVIDLTRAGELVRSRTADAFFTLIFVAVVYLILVFGLSAVFKRFERRLNKSDRN